MENVQNIPGLAELFNRYSALETVRLLSQQPPDVMLKCGQHVRGAHKIVISLGSKYLEKEALKISEDGTTIIMPANVPFEHLEYILHYIYNGYVDIPEEVLQDVIGTAKFLQVVGLSGKAANQNDAGTNTEYQPSQCACPNHYP